METHSPLSPDQIWCVIPVFNHKDTVKEVVRRCRSRVPRIVVVDDGSTDTDVRALLAGSSATILRHEKNRGKGAAILTALRYIEKREGRFLITVDADGEHDPRNLEKFIPRLPGADQSILIGSRGEAGGGARSRSAGFWLRLETGIGLDDCRCGFRRYPVRYLSRLRLHGRRFEFEAEVLTRAVWAGLQLRTVTLKGGDLALGNQPSHFRPFLDNLLIFGMHLRLLGRHLLPFPHRRLIPIPARPLDRRLLFHPLRLLKKLLKENASPGGLAGAAAVGIFIAALPLVSMHTLVIIYVAARLHLNKVMAVTIQNLATPPFVPVICIEIGHYLRYGRWLTDVSFQVVFGQIHQRLWEWLLGSLIVAPLLAGLVGTGVYFTARTVQKKTRSGGENTSRPPRPGGQTEPSSAPGND